MTKRNWIQSLVHSDIFERIVVVIIILNAALTGYQVNYNLSDTLLVENIILFLFSVEIVLRFAGRISTKEYFTDGWNYFDVFIVAVSFISEDVLGGVSVSVLRTLRILRVFRVLHKIEELRLITSVLLKSIKSLGYSAVLFFIFLYVYAVVGVSLFRDENFTKGPTWTANPQELDPYGTIGEAMFTLFRIMTGEDWTDLRYNLLQLVPNLDSVVTFYHVSWMVLSGFLLINLVVGAVVNNFDRSMKETRDRKKQKTEE